MLHRHHRGSTVGVATSIAVAAFAILLATCATAWADTSIASQGELGAESRAFFPDGEGDGYNVAAVGRITIDASNTPFSARLRGFVRHDGVDRQRSALFPEEAWLEYKHNPFRLRVGYQMQTWTATEAFHPADIVNSRYLDGNVQSPEKLGELTAAARLKFLEGNVEAFFMPLFTEPILPSSNSRYRFGPVGVQLGELLVSDRSGNVSTDRWAPQWGASVQQTLWGADISAHVVQHIDRSLPQVVFDPMSAAPPQVLYQHVTQVGGTYQQAFGPIVAKLEGAFRIFKDPDELAPGAPNHGLLALGLEYGFGHDAGGESTFLLEGQSALGLDDSAANSFLLFQRDALVGYRYAHGDENDQTATASTIVDLENREQLFGNIEYGRRLGETWRLQTGMRFIWFPPDDPANPQGPENLHKANYGYLNLTRFF